MLIKELLSMLETANGDKSKKDFDFSRMMAGAMSRKEFNAKWNPELSAGDKAKKASDFTRMMAGAMSRKEFNAKWVK